MYKVVSLKNQAWIKFPLVNKFKNTFLSVSKDCRFFWCYHFCFHTYVLSLVSTNLFFVAQQLYNCYNFILYENACSSTEAKQEMFLNKAYRIFFLLLQQLHNICCTTITDLNCVVLSFNSQICWNVDLKKAVYSPCWCQDKLSF